MTEPAHIRLQENLRELEASQREMILKRSQLEEDLESEHAEILESIRPKLDALGRGARSLADAQ